MIKEEFDRKYVGENLAVNCKTEEDAREFLNLADNFGYHWVNGDSYFKDIQWSGYGKDTCYELKTGHYTHTDYYKKSNYEVITYPIKEDILIKDKLVAGKHVVEYENGERGLFLNCGLSGEYKSNIQNRVENINKIYEIKEPLSFRYLLKDENLKLVWENKDKEKEGE